MKITIQTTVQAPLGKVWECWVTPKHIVQWNFASDDWRCPGAEINLIDGGRFCYRMEASDGSMGFDFEGVFTRIVPAKRIEFVLGDARTVLIEFVETANGVTVTEIFAADDEHSGEQQKQGWQSILNNFKRYVETSNLLD